MKKFIITLALIIGIVSLSSCGGSGSNKTDKTERPAEVSVVL